MKSTNLPSAQQNGLNKLVLIFFVLTFLTLMSPSHATRYFICGPDENGCYGDIYQYCSCIPYNEAEANKPYCFNFDTLSCTPLSQTPDCHSSAIYQNQGTCLATVFHSIPTNPCMLTTHSFCLENNSYFCAPDGNPDTCHK